MGRSRAWDNKKVGQFKVGDLVIVNYKAKFYAVIAGIEERRYKDVREIPSTLNPVTQKWFQDPARIGERYGDILRFKKVANLDFSPIRNYTGGMDEAWFIKIDRKYFDNLEHIVNQLKGMVNL
jgi:hypothetical protein